VAPDFTAGNDMLLDFPIDTSIKKRNAAPEFSEIVSNQKKEVQQTKNNATVRMMETGAAIAAQGAAMLQTITSSSRKHWPKSHGREQKVQNPAFVQRLRYNLPCQRNEFHNGIQFLI
jgi:hypothetical protein